MSEPAEQLTLDLWPQRTLEDWDRPDADDYRRWGLSGRLPPRSTAWSLPDGTGWWHWVPPQSGHTDDGTLVHFVGYRIRPQGCICNEESYAVSLNGHDVPDCPANPWKPDGAVATTAKLDETQGAERS